MQTARKPWWQQATAIVSLGAGGAVTGLSFVPRAAAEIKSPSNMLVRLLAQEQPAPSAPADDAALRSAIVNVASYYLRMAAGKTPAEMEAIIWQHDSLDGTDHGESCAAFASLTLELAAQAVGQQSWVTGGSSYPWPLHDWADVRVEPNPASPGIVSVQQDARAHQRWHPLGDGYQPRPGDWVLFNGHVEVVTKYSGGVLRTIGGDSRPDFSVNAHDYGDPLGADGVVGFVNNGELAGAVSGAAASPAPASVSHPAGSQAAVSQAEAGPTPNQATSAAGPAAPAQAAAADDAAIPGMPGPAASVRTGGSSGSGSRPGRGASHGRAAGGRRAASPGPMAGSGRVQHAARHQATRQAATLGESAIPGLPAASHGPAAASIAPSATRHSGGRRAAAAPVAEIGPQQAFITEIAPGAIAAQRKYGVPASVTIAQAIDESGWGQSDLATRDHNLFGIKGSGPAGSDPQPTQEYENGQSVTRTALFRIYHDAAESMNDHGKLLATSGYYRRAMADRRDPNAFATALTGVYATDPDYGSKLIGLMQEYDLYRYDAAVPAAPSHSAAAPHAAATSGGASIPGVQAAPPAPAANTSPPAPSPPAPSPSPPSPSAPPPSAPSPSPSSPSTPTPTPSTPSPAPSTPAPAPSTPTSSAPAPSTPAPSAPIPGSPAPSTPAPSTPAPGPPAPSTPAPGAPSASATPGPSGQADAYQASPMETTADQTTAGRGTPKPGNRQVRRVADRTARDSSRYQPRIPPAVRSAFNMTARRRLVGEESLYRDVASHTGIPWELLAACDWMQCEARPRYSPVHGEKLRTVNPNGTVYRTKSEALDQCADDLADLAWTVYGIDLTAAENLSVRDLASTFAAFRWGGLLKLHRTSAMEFPYSVAGLTDQHVSMRWPSIDDPNTPDKPGGRFRMPFGAVPVVLGLNYPATV